MSNMNRLPSNHIDQQVPSVPVEAKDGCIEPELIVTNQGNGLYSVVLDLLTYQMIGPMLRCHEHVALVVKNFWGGEKISRGKLIEGGLNLMVDQRDVTSRIVPGRASQGSVGGCWGVIGPQDLIMVSSLGLDIPAGSRLTFSASKFLFALPETDEASPMSKTSYQTLLVNNDGIPISEVSTVSNGAVLELAPMFTRRVAAVQEASLDEV